MTLNNKTIIQHLKELRLLLLCCFVLFIAIFIMCFYYVQNINSFLLNPLFNILGEYNVPNTIVSTNLTDVFFSNIKLAFYSTIFCVLPIILLLIYFYIVSALNKNENKIAIFIVIASPILFWLGLFLAYYFGFNVILKFFINYSVTSNIQLLPKLIDYISLMLQVLLVFALIFQLPVIVIVLGVLGIITSKNLLQFAKFAIVIAFIIAAIFTPPDPLSQIIMASVIIILYYISYLVLRFIKL